MKKNKIYMVKIQDGENVYYEWVIQKPNASYVDGFMRAVTGITAFDITEEEIEVLRKFRVI